MPFSLVSLALTELQYVLKKAALCLSPYSNDYYTLGTEQEYLKERLFLGKKTLVK
jgi:hypothetical protein